MSYYIEPYILFILGCLFFHEVPNSPVPTAFFMIALLIISLQIIISNHRVQLFILLTSVFIALFYPPFLVFIPACAYVPFYQKAYYLSIIFLVPYLIKVLSEFVTLDLIWPFLMLFSFYLSWNACKKNELRLQVKKLRDNAVEQEMILRNQNEKLVASQNDQIYIATLQERNRIAREIHDNVGHMLSSSILQVGALLAICKEESCKPLLEVLKDTLNNAMNSIRNSVHDLHDESIDLKEALTGLCNGFTFCPVILKCDVKRDVPKEIKYSFLSITKEALNNTMKHSNATKAEVTVREHPGFYQLLIEDNGTSARKKALSGNTPSGIGLTNMQDRVKALNGILHINTDHSFRIFISIPKS